MLLVEVAILLVGMEIFRDHPPSMLKIVDELVRKRIAN